MIKKLLLTIMLLLAAPIGTGVAFANCLTYPAFLANNKDLTEQTFALKQDKVNQLVIKLSAEIEAVKLGKLKDGRVGLLIVGSGGCVIPQSIIAGPPEAIFAILQRMELSFEDFVKEEDA